MTRYVLKNNAQSNLVNNPLSIDGTEMTVTTGDGANFPSTFPFLITVWDELTSPFVTEDPNQEIMIVTGRTDDVLTITRGAEDSSASIHQQGARIAMLITAGILDQIANSDDYLVKTADYTAQTGDKIIKVTTAGVSITLPTASDKQGMSFSIDNASTGDIYILPTGAETIESETSQTVPDDSCIDVYSDGDNYRIK